MPYLEKAQGNGEPSQARKEPDHEELVEVEILEPESSDQVEASGIGETTEAKHQPAANEGEPSNDTPEPEADQQNLDNYLLARDRTRRVPKPSSRYSEAEYFALQLI